MDGKGNNQNQDSSKEKEPIQQEARVLRLRDMLKPPPRFSHAMLAIEEPQTYTEAISSPEAERWKKAINEEIESHIKNATWYEEEMPENKKTINCRWLFKLKQTPGEEDRFKARLVARGFTQGHRLRGDICTSGSSG